MVQKTLLLVCVIMSLGLSAQGLDFEQTGFEIKAVAMQEEKSVLAYYVSENELPSRYALSPVLKKKEITYSPIAETPNANNTQNPDIQIATLKSNKGYAFGNEGTGADKVENIAYKAASGGNVYDAYCRGVYANRASN